LILLFIAVTLASCSSTTKTIRFAQAEDEIIKTDPLKQFLENEKNPKVVLRVNEGSYSITEDENNDYLYNSIESKLLSSGFIVRDRQLFNQIVGNKENSIDYEKLKNQSDTDIIIELTKLDSRVLYKTEIFEDNKGKKWETKGLEYRKYGAVVEFKIILINSNELGGVYRFNYTPCLDGCLITNGFQSNTNSSYEKKKTDITDNNIAGLEKDVFEEFIKDATNRLVVEMRE